MAEDLTEETGKNIPLSEMIESLRQELAVAVAKGEGQAVRFQVEEAEVEVELMAKKVVAGEAGVKFWVVNAGGKASKETETTHRLKLRLTPLDGKTGGKLKAGRSSGR